MLKIRLQRVGRVNVPTFRVVLTDSKNSTKSGRFLEILGNYDPVNDVKEIKADRVKHWMSHGAKLSDTVHNWMIDKKIIPGKKLNKLPRKSPIVDPKAVEAAKVAEAAKATAAAPAAKVEEAPKAEEAKAPEAAPAEAPKA